MILAGQLPKALDLTVPAGLNTVEVVQAVASGIGGTNPAALALALGVVGTMHAAPKLHPKIPSALVAVGGATAASQLLGLSATPIGALPSGLSAFTLCMPALPAAEALPSLCGTILLIYAMTSAETRLSREAEYVFLYPNRRSRGPVFSCIPPSPAAFTVFAPPSYSRAALNTLQNTALPPSCRRMHTVGSSRALTFPEPSLNPP